MKIGIVGLGAMGLPMAIRLAERGFQVLAFDAGERARQRAADAGLRVASALDEFRGIDGGSGTEVVVTMLPEGRAVRQVLIESGLGKALAPHVTIIDSSSSDPRDTAETGLALLAAGVAFLDAPVSGNPAAARSGDLTLLVGGDPTAVCAARHVLDALGRVHHVGGLGAGHALKALNNFLAATSLAAAGEAMLAGRKFGIEPDVMLRVLNSSSGRNAATEDKVGQFILTRTFDSGFSLGLMRKDVAIARSLITSRTVSFGFVETCDSVWGQALDELEPGADNTEIVRWMESVTGEVLGGPPVVASDDGIRAPSRAPVT